jgi:hypothetical protein
MTLAKTHSAWRFLSRAVFFFKKYQIQAFFSVLIILGIFGSWKIGTYVDAPTDALFAKYNFGKLLRISSFQGGYSDNLNTYVASYGYSVTLLLFGPIWVLGKFFDPSHSLQNETAMFFRNLTTYFIGLLGILAIYNWGKIVLNPRLKILPLLIPIISPVLFGNLLMNSKDVPLFTGFAAIIYLFAKLFDNKSSEKLDGRIVILWLMISIIFTIGVRPISLVWMSPLLLAFIFLVIKRAHQYLKHVLFGISMSALYIIFTNYFLITSPIYWFSNLFDTGKNFPWTGAVLSWGKLYRSPDIPSHYFLEILISQIPLFILLLLLISIGLFGRTFTKQKKKVPVSVVVSFLCLIILLVQTFVMKPIIYDNARQLLFVWVFILVIACWTLGEIYPRINKFNALAVILVILSSISLVDQIRLFPYNYIYRNEIARSLPQGSFETDYWGLSGKELTKWVVEDSLKDRNRSATFAYIFPQSYDPYVRNTSLVPVSTADHNAKYYSQIWRPGLLPDFSAQCPIVFSVDRSFLFGKKEVLGYVRKC